ncbi:hypothetical protein [Methanosarcina sp.]|uniref:hypothetical protein n=1 Tax=Methanosarcina sp. TaxID=2213 RepID=UPI002ABA3DE5|nr:hypothetical protein [Methanosarcina sp.]MDY9924906.1 hypothetical protein [Methanosarcina sp.]
MACSGHVPVDIFLHPCTAGANVSRKIKRNLSLTGNPGIKILISQYWMAFLFNSHYFFISFSERLVTDANHALLQEIGHKRESGTDLSIKKSKVCSLLFHELLNFL